MERRRVDTLVVGAGPTGLGAAWRLSALGDRDWCLCEASAAFGGLAGSIVDADGFTWDFGGHVQHSHYGYFDELMDDLLGREGWISHRRESWIWIADRFVPYPFQLNLHRLPAVVFDECLDGLRAAAAGVAGTGDAPRNFAQWIDATFGRGIARHFMRPYNLKVWACPLEDMDWRWTGDRVAVVDRTRAFKGEAEADARDDTSWGPNREFRFPLRGGTGAVWTTLGERLQRRHPESILMTRTLTGVDSGRRLAYFDNGLTIEFGRLLTTMPLDAFVGLSDLKGRLGPAATALRYTTTHVVGVALHGAPPESLSTKCWMYFPGADCPFYRVTVFSRYSPHNVPDADRYWSLMAEVSQRGGGAANDGLVERTLQGLVDTRLIASRTQVHHVWHRRLERGYPVPTLGRDAALREILTVLEGRDVYSRGRFGAWKYEVSNQDHSFAQGVEVVDGLVSGAPERTLNDPAAVNAFRR